jgi:hypothetical protein
MLQSALTPIGIGGVLPKTSLEDFLLVGLKTAVPRMHIGCPSFFARRAFFWPREHNVISQIVA